MVALFVILTIVLCVSIDGVIQFRKAKRERASRNLTDELVEVAALADVSAPANLFLDSGHTWVEVKPSGAATIGVDGFAQKLIGRIDDIVLPEVGKEINRGEVLFAVGSTASPADGSPAPFPLGAVSPISPAQPATFPPTVPIAWTDVSGKPATFPPTLPTDYTTGISGKPSTFPPTLPIAQTGVTNLVSDQGLRLASNNFSARLMFCVRMKRARALVWAMYSQRFSLFPVPNFQTPYAL